MSRIFRTPLIPSLLAAAALLPATAMATENRIGPVTVEEGAEATIIRIAGTETPTYSVYRLRNPLRLFVDVSNGTLADEPELVDVRNGVVSQIATVAYDDELSDVARVVIGFDVDATYDVSTEGDSLVITVDGAERHAYVAAADDEARAALEAELAASAQRIAALEQARLQAEARAQSAEADVLEAQIAREEAEQARLAALAAQSEAGTERLVFAAQVEALEARETAVSAELAAAREALAARDAELSAQRAALEAALAEARAQQVDPTADDPTVTALRAELAALADEAASVRAQQAEQQSSLARVAAERDAALAALASERSTVESLRAQWAEPAVAGPASIGDIRFEQDDGVDRIVIDVPAGANFVSEPWADDRSAMTFAGAVLPDHLQRTLDTQAFGGAVAFVSSFTDADGSVRVVAQLNDVASEIVRQEDDRIVWEFRPARAFASAPVAATSAAGPVAPTAAPVAATSYGDEYGADAFSGASPFQRTPRMTRKRITIDLRNADIQNVLRLLAEEGNLNIVASDDVTGSVTLRLRSVPLDEALSMILQSKGLGWVQDGTILRVAPLGVFEAEYERELQRMADAFGLEPLQVRLIPVNYAEAQQLSALVGSVLSPRGSVAVDIRNNMLVVTDIFSHLETAQTLVQQLDNQTPQILIEARIVETSDNFQRRLGIQWGGDYLADQSIGNSTGLLFPSTIGIAGGATDGQAPTAGGSSTPNYAVNLPAPAGTGTGGALGFTFGSLSGSFNLNLRLSAAESEGSAKIISAPRIMTLDNQQANITSGRSIPVATVSAAGAQTTFVDASLTLNVTPRVTPDGNIFLNVQITKNEPDFENTGSRGDPSIITRSAQTQLLVRDGDTTVIGGIFTRNTGFSSDRVPFLGTLPVIGPLFRNSSRTDVRSELLVFITPRIVNRDVSIDQYGAGGDILRPDDE